jgi:beta-1,4-mannosyl-glycoprotein beta-1,4-N-acetylglucosaminyltransferase
MSRPLVIDTFPINNELDMLAGRLETMDSAVDYFIAVEADVDHQDHPKPFHISDNLSEFDAWADKLIVVQAVGLPTVQDDPDPWARELMQREYVLDGLREVDRRVTLTPDAIVLHGDVDELCRPICVRNVRPKFPKHPGKLPDGTTDLGFVSFNQRGHFFAVDWLYPDPWGGTVAGTLAQVMELGPHPFHQMRNTRNWNPVHIDDAGWHLSWLGGQEAALKKLGSFCHPEVAERTLHGLSTDRYLREGMHLDGRVMAPVDVDETWPAFIHERRCPAEWFRPRD